MLRVLLDCGFESLGTKIIKIEMSLKTINNTLGNSIKVGEKTVFLL